MKEANDLLENCVCCSHSYVDYRYNELVCDITGGFCELDLATYTYRTCEEFNEIRSLRKGE